MYCYNSSVLSKINNTKSIRICTEGNQKKKILKKKQARYILTKLQNYSFRVRWTHADVI